MEKKIESGELNLDDIKELSWFELAKLLTATYDELDISIEVEVDDGGIKNFKVSKPLY